MSRHDQLFCAQVASLTHSKKLHPVRKDRIRSMVKAMTVGTVKRATMPRKK